MAVQIMPVLIDALPLVVETDDRSGSAEILLGNVLKMLQAARPSDMADSSVRTLVDVCLKMLSSPSVVRLVHSGTQFIRNQCTLTSEPHPNCTRLLVDHIY